MLIQYIIKRILILIPVLIIISFISFTLIQLPPGDYLNMYIMQLKAGGTVLNEEEITQLRLLYGLDKTFIEQYYLWIKNILLYGNFGNSFQYNSPVSEILIERVPPTAVISILTIIFIWIVSIPIGIYSATNQYSIFDYFWTFFSFIGISVPSFLLALIFIWIAFVTFDISAIGLFSREYENADWSLNKFYFDENYNRYLYQPFLRLAKTISWLDWEFYDKYFINGFGRVTNLFSKFSGKLDYDGIDQGLVDGLGRLSNAGGKNLRKIQTGRLQNYLLYVVAGILVIIIIQAF